MLAEADTSGGITTTTLYLPGEQLSTDGTTTTGVRYYTFAGHVVAETAPSTVYWLTGNTQGTMTTAVAAFSQATVIRRTATPYGTVLNGSGTWPDNRTFLGDPSHPSTGLVDVGARKYDPATGLFISVDPNLDVANPQTMTGYTYADDNPVTNSDPTGLLMFMDDGGGGGSFAAPPSHSTPARSGPSFQCPGLGCTAANYTSYSGGVVAAGIQSKTNWPELRFFGKMVRCAKCNLAAGSDDPANINNGLGQSDLENLVPHARAQLFKAMGTNRFGIPTTKLGWGVGGGLAVLGGAVDAYGEWNLTNHDWGKTIAVGVSDTEINVGAGIAGAAVGGAISGALAGGLMGAEIGAFAGPIGLVAGAVVGAAISLVATTVVNNVINDLNPFNW